MKYNVISCCREHDKKVCCLGLTSLLALPADQLPGEALGRIFRATLDLLVAYKDQVAGLISLSLFLLNFGLCFCFLQMIKWVQAPTVLVLFWCTFLKFLYLQKLQRRKRPKTMMMIWMVSKQMMKMKMVMVLTKKWDLMRRMGMKLTVLDFRS